MTDHPCKGMTPLQIQAFEKIAVGDPLPSGVIKSFKALQAKGLIERGPDKVLRDRLGSFGIPQYQVPIRHHMQWCQWCSEQPENQE